MSTVLDFKTAVARQLGKSNAAVDVPKRDGALGEAILQYTDEYPWSWNETSVAKSNLGTVPTDFNSRFDPKAYYADTATSIVDVAYVPYAYFATRSDAVFSVNAGSVYTNVTVPITILYQKKAQTIATNGSDNATTLTIPNITTITKLAIALYWLAAERDETNYDRFMRTYDQRLLPDDIMDDRKKDRYTQPRTRKRAMGWNVIGA